MTKLEDELEKIQGVTGVRIIGDEAPSEIHVVATTGRAPKQIVRDVQSLTTTNLGEPIDHRIVSVVQVDESEPEAKSSSNGAAERIVIDQVVTASKIKGGWIRVYLKLPGGHAAEGAALAGTAREERARAAVAAAIKALQPRLDAIGARLALESLVVQNDVQSTSVQIRCSLYTDNHHAVLVGAAVIEDDVATAAVRALLQAINRKVS
ncbi:MAG TPA: hypothetical protein VG929_05580 [Actinomycetota bacterium]|nr:hypothetical protein [Actinomycetota bacterium]